MHEKSGVYIFWLLCVAALLFGSNGCSGQNHTEEIVGILSYQETSTYLKYLRQEEGFRSEPYWDSKGWSIGYGRFFGDRKPEPVSHRQAIMWLIQDADDSVRQALEITAEYNLELEFPRFMVLAAMCFQMGKHSVLGFKDTIKAMQKRDFERVSKEMLDSDWHRQDSPDRARELADWMAKNRFANIG